MAISICVQPDESLITYYLYNVQPLWYRALVTDVLLCWYFEMLGCLSEGFHVNLCVRRCCGWWFQTGPPCRLRGWCYVVVWGLEFHMFKVWWLWRWWGLCCHIFLMIDVRRVYMLPVKIVIGVYYGGCLSYVPMVASLVSSSAWAEHEIMWSGVSDIDMIYTLWIVIRVWILFHAKVPCNRTTKFVKHVLHMNVDINMMLVYRAFTSLSHLHWMPGPGQGSWSPCPRYLPCA